MGWGLGLAYSGILVYGNAKGMRSQGFGEFSLKPAEGRYPGDLGVESFLPEKEKKKKTVEKGTNKTESGLTDFLNKRLIFRQAPNLQLPPPQKEREKQNIFFLTLSSLLPF